MLNSNSNADFLSLTACHITDRFSTRYACEIQNLARNQILKIYLLLSRTGRNQLHPVPARRFAKHLPSQTSPVWSAFRSFITFQTFLPYVELTNFTPLISHQKNMQVQYLLIMNSQFFLFSNHFYYLYIYIIYNISSFALKIKS